MVPGPNEVVTALSRLAILPNPNEPAMQDNKRFVESFWEQVPIPTIDPNIWDTAQAEVVTLSELKGTDPYLKRSKIEKHIVSMGQALTPFMSLPYVVEYDGSLIIVDGHHRLAALWLLGVDRAPVWLAKESQ